YLLGRINELSEGKSLTANIALIKNNARVGAKIAYELIK
ncbi:MAG: pseudouridine-5'-phosphate glycosidase, partial [Candidatus Caldatribacteriota bacterium]|nr:pseudouridine-5'-phosphate glycosidase [Candidatus Caldatribacteriota bacterium]